MTTYTAEQVKDLTKVDYWPLRKCSICGVDIGYRIHPDDRSLVAFDSSCDCNGLNGWQQRSWDDIATAVNRQTEEVQQRMLVELRGEKT